MTRLFSLLFHGALALMGAHLVQMLVPEFHLLICWLLAVNGIMLLSFGYDKLASKLGSSRVPETTFFALAAGGAFPALFAGRKLFNHKTSKSSFSVPMWILFGLQLTAGVWLMYGDTPSYLAQSAEKSSNKTTERSQNEQKARASN